MSEKLKWVPGRSEQSVTCAGCRGHFAAAECVRARVGTRLVYACSEDCQERFAERNPGAAPGAIVKRWDESAGDGPLSSETVGLPHETRAMAERDAARFQNVTGKRHWVEDLSAEF
jgi:hypothetical protein